MTLELRGIAAGYGGNDVLRGVSLRVEPGEVVTLVGANGAGKSTLVKTVSGLLRPSTGQVLFDGQPVHRLSPAERLRRGIVHVPEGRQVFAGLTVEENLRLGSYLHRGADLPARLREVCELFPVLGARLGDVAGNFSGGQQQMLAIARGMMGKPKLLILDEPSLGLSPQLVAEVFRLVQSQRGRGIAILLAEQNARAALLIADRGYVIENGSVAMEGAGRDLLASPEIAHRYLGTGEATQVSAEESRRLAERLRELVFQA